MCLCPVCINEMNGGIVENCGTYTKTLPPGLHCLICCVESIRASVSLKIQHLEVDCDTKTKDNVFVKAVIAVQYRVVEDKINSAFYKLTDPRAQIKSYVYDVIRSTIPTLDLDDAFASKEHVAHSVRDRLAVQMADYGFEIVAALVVDLDPDARVKAAMNDINASQRLREAQAYKAEAEKILQVKAAEADAESKYLAGVGVARQRKAIVDGLRETVTEFSATVAGTGPKDVMDLLLLTQYFDMVRDIGGHGSASTLFLPHGPQAIKTLRNDLADSFQSGSLGVPMTTVIGGGAAVPIKKA